MSDPRSTERIPGTNWTPRAYRNLKIAVIVMGIFLVAGFAVVFGTIIARLAATGEGPASAPAATEIAGEVARLLGPESEIVSTIIEGNRLALVLRRSEGLSVIVVDLRSGEVVNIITGTDRLTDQ